MLTNANCNIIELTPEDDQDVFDCGIIASKCRRARTTFISAKPYTVPETPPASGLTWKEPAIDARLQKLSISVDDLITFILESK